MDNILWQVSNLELSKILNNLGFKEDSVWEWVFLPKGIPCEEGCSYKSGWRLSRKSSVKLEKYNAYTVAELGKALLEKYYSRRTGRSNDESYVCESFESGGDGSFEESEHKIYGNTYADTEANSRTKLLIYLVKNKIIKFKLERK